MTIMVALFHHCIACDRHSCNAVYVTDTRENDYTCQSDEFLLCVIIFDAEVGNFVKLHYR